VTSAAEGTLGPGELSFFTEREIHSSRSQELSPRAQGSPRCAEDLDVADGTCGSCRGTAWVRSLLEHVKARMIVLVGRISLSLVLLEEGNYCSDCSHTA